MKSFKSLFIAAMVLSSFAHAAEPEPCSSVRTQFGYLAPAAGVYYFIPGLGLNGGYRWQVDRDGFDISFTATSSIIITTLEGTFLLHHYFTPNALSEYYLGWGVSAGGMGTLIDGARAAGIVRPVLAWGKQYANKYGSMRFFELALAPIFYFNSGHSGIVPAITFRYAFAL